MPNQPSDSGSFPVFSDETPGGRLNRFWPKNEFGKYWTKKAWAEAVGIDAGQFGKFLENKTTMRTEAMEKIAIWLGNEGVNDTWIAWWIKGGAVPQAPVKGKAPTLAGGTTINGERIEKGRPISGGSSRKKTLFP